MDKMAEQIDEKMLSNFQDNWKYCEDVERNTNEVLATQKKTINNMKFELVEILDTKQENMQRTFDIELSRVK